MKERLKVQDAADALEKTKILTYNFYTARNISGVTCFYDKEEICWFGTEEKEKAFNFEGVAAAVKRTLNDMPEYNLTEEKYQILYDNEKFCLVSGFFQLKRKQIGIKPGRSLCFWKRKNGEWRLCRLRLSLPKIPIKK